MVKESSIKIDDTVINYVKFGKGKKTLVLIFGLSLTELKGSGLSLSFAYRYFSKEYTVYSFDRRENIPDGFTVENIADDFAYCMKQLNISNADILSISQGGMIAQNLAIKYPELVNKMCLGVTLSRNNPTALECVNNWIKLSEENKYEDLIDDMFRKIFSEKYLKKTRWMFPLLKKIGQPKNKKRFINNTKACLTCNTYDKLDQIKCPVLVLGGKKDLVLSGEASEEIAEKLGCEIYMYEDLGHSAYEEGIDFNKRALEFFRK